MPQSSIENDLVSIILPVYNGERFLTQSIKSCLEQTHNNIELIIVNDCSTDNSLKIAENFKLNDDRVSIISNATNKKLPFSLNIGHKTARGKFVTWTSDDNFYEKRAIETLLKTIQNNHWDIVYSNFNIIEESGRFRKIMNLENASSLLFGNSIGASFLYKKDVFIRNDGYDNQLHSVEDYDFWLRASLHSKFLHLDKILYNFRSHDASLSSKLAKANTDENELFAHNIQKSYYKFLKNLGIEEAKKVADFLTRIHLYKEIDVLSYFGEYRNIKIVLDKILNESVSLKNGKFWTDFDIRIRATIQGYEANQNVMVLWQILRKRPELLWKYDRKNSLKIIQKCLK